MYIDTAIVASIVIVLAMVIGTGWMADYTYKHVRRDVNKSAD